MNNLASINSKLYNEISSGKPLILATDVDGTLTMPSPTEERIRLYPGILQSLKMIADRGGKVIIASARDVDALDREFGHLQNIILVANDGYVIRANGVTSYNGPLPDYRNIHLEAEKFAFTETRIRPRIMGAFYGIFVNRRYEIEYQKAFEFLLERAKQLSDRLGGREVVINKHPMGITMEPRTPGKAAALTSLLSGVSGLTGFHALMYTGDGSNDEGAFSLFESWQGNTFKVLSDGESSGNVTTAARNRLAGVEKVAELYEAVAREMNGRHKIPRPSTSSGGSGPGSTGGSG